MNVFSKLILEQLQMANTSIDQAHNKCFNEFTTMKSKFPKATFHHKYNRIETAMCQTDEQGRHHGFSVKFQPY